MYNATDIVSGIADADRHPHGNGDRIIHNFVEQLLPPDEASKVLCGDYTSALHSALVAQLAMLRRNAETTATNRLNPLPKWRLKRVQDFVVANLDGQITLPTLAAVAGVSRMYFASQFRKATGMRPHDYVTELRIAVARDMLADERRPIIDIAFSVGFQTQSHFTTVFKTRTGMTPRRFRQAVAGGF